MMSYFIDKKKIVKKEDEYFFCMKTETDKNISELIKNPLSPFVLRNLSLRKLKRFRAGLRTYY